MKIIDCFMYFDEDVILDLRLNTLNEYVNHFVIVESNYKHNGEKRDLNFDISKFRKFKEKITYLIYDEVPKNIFKINASDKENITSEKYILNAAFRENGQRNFIMNGLKNADKDDLILISDVDEIPNLSSIDFYKIKNKLIFFNQEMFYYKFNLKLPNFNWVGTKACKMKNLINPQWLRNIKDRSYPFYRIDTFFSNNKYMNIKFINNGGWHFTNIKYPEQILNKLKSYLHHREFDLNPLSIEEIQSTIKNHTAIYDLRKDQRETKIGKGSKLEKYELEKLPPYIKKNPNNFKDWLA